MRSMRNQLPGTGNQNKPGQRVRMCHPPAEYLDSKIEKRLSHLIVDPTSVSDTKGEKR